MKKLIKVQKELEVLKTKKNDFGGFNYRSVAEIYENLKGILYQNDLCLVVDNELVEMLGTPYVKSIATITDEETKETVTVNAYAAIDFSNTKMNASQAVGSASSYANKYALSQMFMIDDGSLDPDNQENYSESQISANKSVQYFDKKRIDKAKSIEELTSLYDEIKCLASEKQKTFLIKCLSNKKVQILGNNKAED